MKKITFPTPYAVLMLVIIFAYVLTYLLPSGGYNTLTFSKEQSQFVVKTPDSTYVLPAEQQTLTNLGIRIDIEKFRQEKIKKPISIPNTYKEFQSENQPISQIIFAPIKGIYDAIDVILFVLILGGFIGVFNKTGVLNQGVSYLSYRLKGREGILIILVCTLIAMGGTSFGLAEETLAFYPMLVPVFLAAGYDLIVPLAVIYLGSSIGSMASTINPFAVIIASDAAGVDWTTGFVGRVIMLVLGLILCILYIIRYAERVRKNPKLSIAYGVKIPESFSSKETEVVKKLKFSSQLLLVVFALSFVVMILGVSQWDWWFEEMTGLFLGASVLIAVLQRTSEKEFVASFIDGARDLLGVAFIIGIARGVTIILDSGQIADTILFNASTWVSGMSPMLFLPMLMLVFALLTLFISSSSGMAVVTMPIMGALAAVVGVQGQNVVNAYLFGMGLMSFIVPTGLILPSLAMVNLNYKHWLKFILPLIGMLMILAVAVLLGDFYWGK